MYEIARLFFLFISYSVMGWVVECIYCSINQHRFCIDRGFLIGPYCPIYGSCCLVMIIVLDKYLSDPLTLFVLVMVVAGLIEYFTSLIMEKLFKVRWWDYSDLPFNIEGRVCLGIILAFGVLGLLFMYVVNPMYSDLVSLIDHKLLILTSFVLFVVFLVDFIISFTVIARLRFSFNKFYGDQTTMIDKEVRIFLTKNTYFISRLLKSFPKINISLPTGKEIIASLNDFISSILSDKENEKKLNKKNKKRKIGK